MSLAISCGRNLALFFALFAQQVWSSTTCNTFGVDFHGGIGYFQNSQSLENFTFVSDFEGCQNAFAHNALTLPDGSSLICSDTPLRPDDTPQLSTCPILKSQLASGEYIIQILSDNNGDTIARSRVISLSVGPQQTSTYIPTVTVSETFTPVINSTSTTTYLSTTTLKPSTVTVASSVLHPTLTVTPAKVTERITKVVATVTKVRISVSITKVTQTKTATCVTPVRQATADPTNKNVPQALLALVTSAPEIKPRHVLGRRLPMVRRENVREENDSSGFLKKRSPDAETITVTDLNVDDYITSTTTFTAPTITVPVVVTLTITTTLTPLPVTAFSGISTAAIITKTAPTPTETLTKYTVTRITVTSTRTKTVTIKTTTTPAAAKASCKAIGGVMR